MLCYDARPKVWLSALLTLAIGCTTSGAQSDGTVAGSGGATTASGGANGAGGGPGASGGVQATGSGGGAAGAPTGVAGGVKGSAGVAGGGVSGSGSGGKKGSGGANGGSAASGGSTDSGGSTGSGGTPGSGGHVSAGSGGASATGGISASGGTSASGGAPGAGGAGGSGGACKRGIATNTAPGAAFHPAVGWWYDWSNQGASGNTGLEFVPMIWGASSLDSAIPADAKFLLTFNEPNFHAQSNLTAAQAAGDWPQIQMKAAGIPIVGPGMNFCGPDSACNGTSPYQYLKDFFAACTGCEVDYVAVHWYNCDLPSLKDYLEPGGSLEGFEQFGKPIWITEFSCDGSASAADQEAYMRAAIPYLEGKANVFRYSWFSAKDIPNAELINSDGSPTALGQVYVSLPGGCGP